MQAYHTYYSAIYIFNLLTIYPLTSQGINSIYPNSKGNSFIATVDSEREIH